MPTLKLTAQELLIHFPFWEKLLALRGDIRIPLINIRGATEDSGFRGSELGLRCPGTNIPGLVSAGVFRKSGHKQFVFIARRTSPIVIELRNQKWDRIVLGVADPRDTAMRIATAISAAG